MEIKHIGIVGCGQMGSGIAEVAAKSGFLVTVREINQELLTRGLDRIKKSMSRAVSRGKLSEEDMEAALGRITGTTEMTDLADCDMVIEAAIENMNLKKEIFQELDDLCRPEAILATNTSSLSVTEIAAVTDRADRVMGVHFFNPVPVMKLVELVSTILTSPTTVATVRGVVEKMGKTPVMANDTPGFIVNRLLVPYIIDAIRAAGKSPADDVRVMAWQSENDNSEVK
jgi:3-hydroxybutyryl-CoA dehydrogenase